MILSIIATIFFGVFSIMGVYYYVRKKHPIEFIFYKEESIDLFNSVSKNLNDLKVIYKNAPIKENMYIIKGNIVHVGRRDITEVMIENPLIILFGKEAIIHEARILDTSPGLKASMTFENNVGEFVFKLFRRGEFIKFEILLECPNDIFEKNEIQFEHRIADANNRVKQIIKEPSLSVYNLIILIIPIILVCIFYIYFSKNYFMTKEKIEYKIKMPEFDSFLPDSVLNGTLADLESVMEIVVPANLNYIQIREELDSIAIAKYDSIIDGYKLIDYWKEKEVELKINKKNSIIYLVKSEIRSSIVFMFLSGFLILLPIILFIWIAYNRHKTKVIEKIINKM
ncbi:MAG: hypothetical protein KAT68_19230 [Bacteroidales bacterium]|nr:hypothetical protein [Bacteroidales bacterium]